MNDSSPQAVQACHALLLWLIPQLDKFPRTRRFTLGERLETALLDVLEHLLEATYSRTKEAPLKRANLRLASARHLWRLAHEMQAVSTRRYAHGAKLMDEVGRQVGGWLRSRGPRATPAGHETRESGGESPFGAPGPAS